MAMLPQKCRSFVVAVVAAITLLQAQVVAIKGEDFKVALAEHSGVGAVESPEWLLKLNGFLSVDPPPSSGEFLQARPTSKAKAIYEFVKTNFGIPHTELAIPKSGPDFVWIVTTPKKNAVQITFDFHSFLQEQRFFCKETVGRISMSFSLFPKKVEMRTWEIVSERVLFQDTQKMTEPQKEAMIRVMAAITKEYPRATGVLSVFDWAGSG